MSKKLKRLKKNKIIKMQQHRAFNKTKYNKLIKQNIQKDGDG